jgi:cytochrome bd-type quinol oxidase subunit 2
MKLIVKLFSSSLAILAVAGLLNTASVGALAQFPPHAFIDSVAANEACQGAGLVFGIGGCENQTNGSQVNSTLTTFINIFSAIVGLVAVIMIIVSGLQFMTSSGNAQNIAKARSTLLYAIVGLVIVVLAQVIVHFVITQATTVAK